MDGYILHEEYYKSIRGEDGEEPFAVHGSRPRTDLGSHTHSGPGEHPAETAGVPPQNLPEWAEEFAEFLLLTGQSHVDVATKCSLLKRSCTKSFLQKKVKQIVKTCSTWAEVLLRLEEIFPVYETDLSVRTQIEELPMLPEFPPLGESLNTCATWSICFCG